MHIGLPMFAFIFGSWYMAIQFYQASCPGAAVLPRAGGRCPSRVPLLDVPGRGGSSSAVSSGFLLHHRVAST